MRDKLKPCPFCGEPAKRITRTVSFGGSWGSRTDFIAVGCSRKGDCPVKPQVFVTKEVSVEAATEIWNTRKEINDEVVS